MTPRMKWVGFSATGLIVLMIGLNIAREPARQISAHDDFRESAIDSALNLYSLHCLECHGSLGRGDDDNPVLNADFVRRKDFTMLYNTIERGRFGTEMTAFGLAEGGVLTRAQIETLVILIQEGPWERVDAYVQAHIPPTPSAAELSGLPMVDVQPTPTSSTNSALEGLPMVDVQPTAATNPAIEGLPMIGVEPTPGGANDDLGRALYVEHCSECHGENAEGTDDGPTLIGGAAQEKTEDEIWQIVSFGVDGTEMEGFAGVLSQTDRQTIIDYIAMLNAGN